jgi:hypothetical protein
MNYLKTFFIATILLTMHNNMNSGAFFDTQTTDVQNISQDQEESTQDETTDAIKETEDSVTLSEVDVVQNWNNHLELLTIEGEYWNKQDNIPNDDWKTEAFRLAKNVLEQDASRENMLKTSFLDAINAKITLEKGKFSTETVNLVKEFDDFITAQTTPQSEETLITQETTIVSEPSPVIMSPEPTQSEQVSTSPSSETLTTTETTTSSTTGSTSNTTKEWDNQLDKIKKEGITFNEIDEILNTTYNIANQLLSSGSYKQQNLQADFYDALEARQFTKKVYPLNLNDTINFFNRAIGIFVPEEEFSYYQESRAQDIAAQQELQKLREEYAQQNTAEREQQKQKEMQIQAALALAREREEANKKTQESEIARLQLLMQQEIAKTESRMKADAEKREKELRDAFAKNIEQQISAQKATAQKGILSNITEAIGNWWYGESTQKPGQINQETENKIFNAIEQRTKDPEATRSLLQKLQTMLITFTQPQFWNEKRNIPNKAWITEMQKIIFDIVVTYEIMSIQDVIDIIKQVLRSSDQITSDDKINFITNEIQAMVHEHKRKIAEKFQAQESIKQQKQAQRSAKKERIILAQQRIKDEQEKKEQEIKKQEQIKTSYKDEKKEWYNVLGQLAQNKQATSQHNHELTQEALKKSQTLMHLASNIPTKNKTALSQKLKQKFSVALLDQQKSNPQAVNIYHDMDIFNQEINKMMD